MGYKVKKYMNIILNKILIIVYNFIFNLFSIFAYIVNFIIRNPKISNRLSLNLTPIKSPLIWVHGASVGELNSITSLIDNLMIKFPSYNILITSHTTTSKNNILNYYKDNPKITHNYLAYDCFYTMSKFINFYNPKLVLWLEQDFFVNCFKIIKNKGIPLLLLNARISDKSFKKWQYVKFFITPLLNSFNNIYAMSMQDKKKLELLSGKEVIHLGNLKYTTLDNYKNNVDKILLSYFKKSYENKNILLALSTHKQEEDIIIECHLKLLKDVPNLVTIIIPRHIKRITNLVNTLSKKYNINIDVWDKTNNILSNDIIMINKIGYTNLFCSLAPITFVGRSLSSIKKGGQNLLEPIACGSIPIFGKNIHNFKDIAQQVLQNNAGIEVSSKEDLYNNLYNLYTNQSKIITIQANATKILNTKNSILTQHMEAIQCYLNT